jgi:hypothetical protein
MDDTCKCGHAFSAHTKDMRGELVRLFSKGENFDYKTGKVVGEAGCTLCDCRHPTKD